MCGAVSAWLIAWNEKERERSGMRTGRAGGTSGEGKGGYGTCMRRRAGAPPEDTRDSTQGRGEGYLDDGTKGHSCADPVLLMMTHTVRHCVRKRGKEASHTARNDCWGRVQRKCRNGERKDWEWRFAIDQYSMTEYRRRGQGPRTDIRRLARSQAIRRKCLDGERIHPHPGMQASPSGRQGKEPERTRETAAALSVAERWEYKGEGDIKSIIYHNLGPPDLTISKRVGKT